MKAAIFGAALALVGPLAGLASAATGPTVPNGEFEDRAQFGVKAPGIEIREGNGRVGSAGLRISPTGPKNFIYRIPVSFSPKHGDKYVFSILRKASGKIDLYMAWQVWKKGTCLAQNWNTKVEPAEAGWETQSIVFPVREKEWEDAEIRFFVQACSPGGKDNPGVWVDYDSATLREDVPEWYFTNVWPTHGHVVNDAGRVRFHSGYVGRFIPAGGRASFALDLRTPDGRTLATRTATPEADTFTVDFGTLAYEGPAQIAVTISDGVSKRKLGEKMLDVKVVAPRTPGPDDVTVGEDGITRLGGKPFMPLGLFTGLGRSNDLAHAECELKRIRAAGFNCIMEYWIANYEAKDPKAYYRTVRDCDLRLLYNFSACFRGKTADHVAKAKRTLADGAPLLGWYLLDEAETTHLPAITAMRRALNVLTPGVPTWQVNIRDLEPFTDAADVLGGDHYLIGNQSGPMKNMDKYLSEAESIGAASMWYCPQCFNWANYDKEKLADRAKYLKEEEPDVNRMLAIALLYASHGVKGFIFYMYDDIFTGPVPELYARRWADVKEVARTMKSLEPFVLSTEPREILKPVDAKGKTRAVVMRDGTGGARVLVLGLDYANEATFTLPDDCRGLVSTFGNCRIAGDRVTFTGGLVSCDLLQPGPTGREWEDEKLLHLNKEPPCAAFASFATVEEAKAVRSERCSRRVCLDSEADWRFNWCRRPEDRPVGFQDPGYDVSGWDVVKVPCSWQAMGINAAQRPYDRPYYTNAHWPFVAKFPANSNCWPRVRGHRLPDGYTLKSDENPVGSYRRDFEVPSAWTGDSVYLEFGAVDSFFYLWVNGRYVGFSKSSRDPARFDVTPFVRPGRNTVALEVYRFSDASYLEAQDMFLLSGLARSVWLFHTPKTHLRDVKVMTTPVRKGVYDGAWKLDLRTEVVGGQADVVPHVFAADGAEIPYPADGVFAAPKLWSAECPNLYTLVLEVKQGGRTLEAAGFQLGFREVEIREAKDPRDRTFLVNGQPVKLRGANRHETSPLYGHYTPDELIELDVRQLKQANCNHVRNSHYPQPDYFYYLCNRYGIYVMDEANVESHGFFYGPESLSHARSWIPAHVDRVVNMVERNKCHPSVVIWSLGNEAGPGEAFRACTEAVRARDLSRPVQYERNNWLTDMGSRQYPEVQWVRDCANGKPGLSHEPPDRPLKYPFHINEYAHNRGNAMGNLKDYQDAIESTTRIMGSAIWDWVDQGLYKKVKVRGEGEERGATILAYGGDFGDVPTAGPFMMNGCVLSDRTPEPGYWEVKHVFQPIVVTRGADGRSVDVKNRHYFRDLSAYDCEIAHWVDGRPVSTRTVTLTTGPQQVTRIPVDEPVGSYRLSFRQKADEGFWPRGWTIADDQVDFTPPSAAAADPSGRLDFGFDPATGELVSLTHGRFFKTELLKEPLTLDLWRAPSQNEPAEGRLWKARGLDRPARTLVSFADRTGRDGVRLVESVVDYAVTDAVFRVASTWRIRNGAAKVRVTVTPSGKPVEPARVGLRTVFAAENPSVDWLGCGPFENYPDRRSGAFLGSWSLRAKDFFVPYDVPQDCGNREGTYRVSLADVTFETDGAPFAFEVSPYAPETLVGFAHPAELPDSKTTFFGLYARVRGLGGNSCGPKPLKRDIVGMEPQTLVFTVR